MHLMSEVIHPGWEVLEANLWQMADEMRDDGIVVGARRASRFGDVELHELADGAGRGGGDAVVCSGNGSFLPAQSPPQLRPPDLTTAQRHSSSENGQSTVTCACGNCFFPEERWRGSSEDIQLPGRAGRTAYHVSEYV